jgi:hypothetical protein
MNYFSIAHINKHEFYRQKVFQLDQMRLHGIL